MAKLTISPYAKLTLSDQDRADLRVLIIEEFEYADWAQSKESSIKHATGKAVEFLESRAFEIINL